MKAPTSAMPFGGRIATPPASSPEEETECRRIAPSFLLLAAALLTGCVGMGDYEDKAAEAAALRGELEKSRGEIDERNRKIDEQERQIRQKDLENQEPGQSLTMARRHSRQIETRVADLRAQMTARQSQQTESANKVQRLQRALESSRAGPGAPEEPPHLPKEPPALRG